MLAAALACALGACEKPSAETPQHEQAALNMESPAPQEPNLTGEAAPQAAATATQAGQEPEDDCKTPPTGMVCIPGGPAVVGSNHHTPAEKPQHQVQVDTFYMDVHEVTNAEYARCEKSGVCPKREKLPSSYGPYLEPNRPAVPITWRMAQRYCLWAGKRLPTEAEWEKVARGGMEARLYPWGNDAPSCDKAQYKGCAPHQTREVAQFQPGPYGVFDMAGNGYEWVQDWATDCFDGCAKACGEDCLRDNPYGPCGGAPGCKGHNAKVLKGGSWYWPADQMRGSWRRAQRPRSGLHRLSFRCASTTNILSQWPPHALSPRPALPIPEPPSAEELAIFRSVRHDTDIMEIPECDRVGEASQKCRDPMSYLKSNERSQPYWAPYLENQGGAYLGLGADQNFDFIALARSRWAFLFDYDPQVVALHDVLRALILAHKAPKSFVRAFSAKAAASTVKVIREAVKDPKDREQAVKLYRSNRGWLGKHYERLAQGRRRWPTYGWLHNPKHYSYIRTLMQQGRIIHRKGNMLTNVVLPDVAAKARQLGVTIRVYYPSNAESQWRMPEQYRQNVIDLPFDQHTVVLRTYLGRWNDDPDVNYWHYTVHGGLHLQESLRRRKLDRIEAFTEERLPTDVPFLSVTRLPSAAHLQLAAKEREDSQAAQ